MMTIAIARLTVRTHLNRMGRFDPDGAQDLEQAITLMIEDALEKDRADTRLEALIKEQDAARAAAAGAALWGDTEAGGGSAGGAGSPAGARGGGGSAGDGGTRVRRRG